MMNKIKSLFLVAAAVLALGSCQKIDRPEMGEFPQDANPPGGPLNFYAAFDGTTADPLMNAVDSIRANFPSQNPLKSVDGIRGKAIQGENKKFIKYNKPNDWAGNAKSFTISFWYKKDGQTKNNGGGNGPEYIFSFRTGSEHWAEGNMFVFLEGNNAAGAVKVMIIDADKKDNWFTWENAQTIPGLLNNQWHHMALVYSAATSGMTLYVDGVANPNVKTWANHGDIRIDGTKITEFRIGAGPKNQIDTDDWLSSTFKGNIDQFRLYSTALTTAQVQALFSGKL